MPATLEDLEVELDDHEADFENPHAVDWEQTGAPPRVHFHDDRYFVKREMTIFLAGKADVIHIHDDRYHTRDEIFQLLSSKSNVGHTHDLRYYTQLAMNQILTAYAPRVHRHSTADIDGLGTAAFRDVGVNAGEVLLVGTTGTIPASTIPDDIGTGSFTAGNLYARGQLRGGSNLYLESGTFRSPVAIRAASTTLTSTSARFQIYNGLGGDTFTLPIVTSALIGYEFTIKNVGTGTVDVVAGGTDRIFAKSPKWNIPVVVGNSITFVASDVNRWIAM